MIAPAILAGALALASAPAYQDDDARSAPTAEGPLDNDAFAPVVEASASALQEGDAALALAQAASLESEVARQLDTAFDRWREALLVGGPGASVWAGGTVDSERRLSEGVLAAVERRLVALTPAERARWVARFEPGAHLALEGLHAGTPVGLRGDRLEELARSSPLTGSAARAEIELGDLALEAGLEARARAWYARAETSAELAGDAEARAAARHRPRATPAAGPAERWAVADKVEFADLLRWTDPERANPRARAGRRAQPGATFLDADRLALQTGGECLILALADTGALELAARIRLIDLLPSTGLELEFDPPPDPPGWPFLPVGQGRELVLVAGRTQPGAPNGLLALELAEPEPLRGLGLELGRTNPPTRLRWAVVGPECVTLDGERPLPELEELGEYEFQPGPVLCADALVVQARSFSGTVRAWLLAFDRRDGRLLWKRLLGAGADRVATQRFADSVPRLAGQPLLALEGEDGPRVFAGTHLGLGVLLDPLLGEPLWSLKNRRRDEHASGWRGARPLVAAAAGGRSGILWAPADSDRLYALDPRPLLDGRRGLAEVALRPPAPLAEARALVAGDAEGELVLGTSGKERTLSQRRAGRDRVDALDLGPEEEFSGSGLASATRAWVATDRGLYLFDRTRELYLLDYAALPGTGLEAPGGDLYARGRHVLVLGAGALWSFLAR